MDFLDAHRGPGRRRLTPDERELIIELRLNRVPVREVARRLDCANATVVKVWKKYLAERSTVRNAEFEVLLEETMARMEKNASDARWGSLEAVGGESKGEAIRFLEAERKALTELTRLHAALLVNRGVDVKSSSEELEATLRSLSVGRVSGVSVVDE